MKIGRWTKDAPWHILLILTAVLSLLPFLWMLATAFKPEQEIFAGGLNPLPTVPTWANFRFVMERVPLFRYFANTLLAAVLITGLKMVTSILAAYGFTRFRFRGREFVFYLCLVSIFVPVQVTMLPNYLLISHLGWLNSFAGLVIPQLADAMGIFLLRQSIRTVPVSLFEAARLDGAGHLAILRRVLLPAIKPAVVALAILFFINAWNEYYWPLLVLNDKSMYTLPLALQMFTSQEGGTAWGVMMAAASLTALPPLVVYLLTQRYVVDSFINSGLKG